LSQSFIHQVRILSVPRKDYELLRECFSRVAILYSSSQNSLIDLKDVYGGDTAKLRSQSFIHQVRILSVPRKDYELLRECFSRVAILYSSSQNSLMAGGRDCSVGRIR